MVRYNTKSEEKNRKKYNASLLVKRLVFVTKETSYCIILGPGASQPNLLHKTARGIKMWDSPTYAALSILEKVWDIRIYLHKQAQPIWSTLHYSLQLINFFLAFFYLFIFAVFILMQFFVLVQSQHIVKFFS